MTTTPHDVVATARKYLYLPDPSPFVAVLGTVAANRLRGDPVWLIEVGPSGTGKTESLHSVESLPDVTPAATITEAGLLSGTPRKQRANGAKGGLLREIGSFGILALKDFTSILSMKADTQAQTIAALREIYDGAWTRRVGTDGGPRLSWAGKLGIVAGCTNVIDRHHGVIAGMGERFVFLRMPELSPSQQARQALDHVGREAAMRAELAEVVGKLFAEHNPNGPPPPIPPDDTDRLIALATLAAHGRSPVIRENYTREIELVAGAEAPARLVKALAQLRAGLLSLGLDPCEVWPLLRRIGLDSMPQLRPRALDALAAGAQDAPMPTNDVANVVRHPSSTTRRALEDLHAYELVDLHRATSTGIGERLIEQHRWSLTPSCRGLLAVINTDERDNGRDSDEPEPVRDAGLE